MENKYQEKALSNTEDGDTDASDTELDIIENEAENVGDSLPEGWIELRDESTDQYYYLHEATGETTWIRPLADIKDQSLDPTNLNQFKDRVQETKVESNVESKPQEKDAETNANEIKLEIIENETENVGDCLPDGWIELTDESTAQNYYLHEPSGETTWIRPLSTDLKDKGLNSSSKENLQEPKTENESQKKTLSHVEDAETNAGDITCKSVEKENANIADSSLIKPSTSEELISQDESFLNSTNSRHTSSSLSSSGRSKVNSKKGSSQEKEHLYSAEGKDCQTRSTTESGAKNEQDDLKDTMVLERNVNDKEIIPIGWKKLFDESTGRSYFFNRKNNIVSWDLPVVEDKVEQIESDHEKSAKHNDLNEEEGSVSLPPENSDATGIVRSTTNLPEGWVELVDDNTGQQYYFNEENNLTSWEIPQKDDQNVEVDKAVSEPCSDVNDKSPLGEKIKQSEADIINGNEAAEPSFDHTIQSTTNLPEGWVELVDENTGQQYYFNEKENLTAWEPPRKDDQNVEVVDKAVSEPRKDANDESQMGEKIEQSESHGCIPEKKVEILPDGWVELEDPSGNTYYFNEAEQSTTWDRPARVDSGIVPVIEKTEERKGTEKEHITKLFRGKNPNHGFASFGFGGRLYIHRPRRQGQLEIHKVNRLLPSHPIVLAEKEKREHGIVGALNCANIDSVSSYISAKDESSSDNLWSLIKIAADSEGRLRSDEGVADTSSPESAMITLFLQSESANDSDESLSEKKVEDIIRDKEALERVESLLLHGKREEAVEQAMSGNQFALALLVAGHCDRNIFKNVANRFAEKILLSGSPLYTLVLLFSGQLELPPENAFEKIGMVPTIWSNSTDTLLRTWKQHLCAMISNRFLGWDKIVLTLGDRLLELGDLHAAHCCYMVCGCPMASVLNSSRLTLIGCDHLVPMDVALLTEEGIMAFSRSEAYEWAKRRGNPDAVIQSFQAFKLAYAMLLVDLGYRKAAEDYVKSIRNCNAAVPPSCFKFTNGKSPSLWTLSNKVFFSAALDEFEHRLLYEKNLQPHCDTEYTQIMNPKSGDEDLVQKPKSSREPITQETMNTPKLEEEPRMKVTHEETLSNPPVAHGHSASVFNRSQLLQPSPKAPVQQETQMNTSNVERAPTSDPPIVEHKKLANPPTALMEENPNPSTSKQSKPQAAPHSAPADLQKLQIKKAPNSGKHYTSVYVFDAKKEVSNYGLVYRTIVGTGRLS